MATFPKLFVTDLDGTALGGGYEPYVRFPDRFAAFLDRLHAAGCRWAINTTWDVNGQWQLVLASAVRSRPAFLMAEVGCRLAEVRDDGPHMVEQYNASMGTAIARVNEMHIHPFIRELVNRVNPNRMNFYGHWFDFSFDEADGPAVDDVCRGLSAGAPVQCERKPGRIVVYPACLGKDKNLAAVLQMTGISPEHVVVAGDEIPDLAMMQPSLAAYAVCPQNANEKVKARVAGMGVVGTATHSDGVIDAFERLARDNKWNW
jgi:hydroxymethylpyrimidine pyrophosphatase-like HAD family hydrolase